MNKERSPYESLLVWCLVLLIAYLIFEISWAAKASLGLGVLGLLSSIFTKYLHRFWTWLSQAIGKVMTPVLLFLVFFFFLWPISLLYRLAGKSSMKKPVDVKSNYVERNHSFSGKDLENMW